MNEIYFDIVAHSSGWTCLVNGRQFARFPSFHQAESEGRRFAASPRHRDAVVVRRQEACGRLKRIDDGLSAHQAAHQAPTRSMAAD